MEELTQAGRSVADNGVVTVDRDPDPIRIIVNSGAGTIQGTTVKEIDRIAAAPAVVALVPPGLKRQNLSLYKSATTGQDGNFILSGIAPGEYKLFAWENIPAEAYQNAEFLAAYETHGQNITVTPAAHMNVRLPVIPSLQ